MRESELQRLISTFNPDGFKGSGVAVETPHLPDGIDTDIRLKELLSFYRLLYLVDPSENLQAEEGRQHPEVL